MGGGDRGSVEEMEAKANAGIRWGEGGLGEKMHVLGIFHHQVQCGEGVKIC